MHSQRIHLRRIHAVVPKPWPVVAVTPERVLLSWAVKGVYSREMRQLQHVSDLAREGQNVRQLIVTKVRNCCVGCSHASLCRELSDSAQHESR